MTILTSYSHGSLATIGGRRRGEGEKGRRGEGEKTEEAG